MNKKFILIGISVLVVLFIGLTIYLLTNRQILFSQATVAPSCPGETQLLFTSSTSLKVGSTVALGGKIESVSGNPTMENRDGVPMVLFAPSIKVKFPHNVFLDSALIFDNDPKQGEKPWSINGVSLPVSGQGKWAPLFKLNLTSDIMNFENGGDSSHFNVCVKDIPSPSSTPFPSNTPGPTKTPTPQSTPTPFETQIPSGSPTPSICPKPNAVTDIQISCKACRQ
ncbi:hypothetical protein A2954_04940 [Candidatus Roizmanbacteria bacterium RIFCSPLOWO2_01_FULL_37_12]|uniref:Uncharacterized protein n=1 Tax=Candidatus Roizmanbacteria bacterium RIFCSPLOWO2_01_FULL_37_12 TaxID=1802056 RepID=A0A1F7I8W6_9BACT|nr:MAG: hypothetical protein A2768_02035 [Candidatus Roizmanbacteria bacterium RIFCSPHIGHO2_01_FULL_37_16]OGK23704.1 MAG: hypothetical protein A3D76_03985 [Candidatus Roizmanbacteria bacterium RIFCSPHIGHO2_02_FULL_37_9b]OGK39742.1 MAG: hypothetical protein A2954_04940 [Candidatus Roizmanbacteria bacterium RIFCSPLOWO2_01_FULL_37_12]